MRTKGTILPVSWALAIGLTAFTLRLRHRSLQWALDLGRRLNPRYWVQAHRAKIDADNAEYSKFFRGLRNDEGLTFQHVLVRSRTH